MEIEADDKFFIVNLFMFFKICYIGSMVPRHNSLAALARSYLGFLATRDEKCLRGFLSLDFVTRRRVTNQMRLIKQLPQFFVAIDMAAHLLPRYDTRLQDEWLLISPFQFTVSYTPPMNLVEIENMILTIQSVKLEEQGWCLESIFSDEEGEMLKGMIA